MENINSFKGYIKNSRESFWYFWIVAKKDISIMIFFTLIRSSFPYLSAYYLGLLINEVTLYVTSHKSFSFDSGLFYIFVVYSILNSLPALVSNIVNYYNKRARYKFSSFMEIEVLKQRERIDIASYEDSDFQDLYQRAFRQSFWPILDFWQLNFGVIKTALFFIVGSVLATIFNPWIYLIIIVSSIPSFIVQYKYGKSLYSIWAKDSPEQRRFSNIRMHFVSRHNLIETKLLQSGSKLLSWCKDILENFNKKQISVERSKTLYQVLSEIIYLLGFSFSFYLIFKDVLSGAIMVGSMIYILRTLDNIGSYFVDFISQFSAALEKSMIVGDLLNFFSTKPFIKKAENPVDIYLTSPPDIVFENVSFKYPNQKTEKYVLRNLNLTFKGGFKIGLVGNNGAGKTTLVKLLCRIYDPTEGRILINGVDLKEINLEKWWGYMSVMLQDYASYDFTVKQAIAIGRVEKDIDDDLVIKSSQISQASEFIEKWENKYDHQIGVEFKGVEPSKGQRQKLAIAKILYRNAFVMILDEPTASVDAESESKIFKSLSRLPNNQTSILVSHDFSMIKECDHIIVLKEGVLFEEGKHKDLMNKKGLYEELFKIQADGFK